LRSEHRGTTFDGQKELCRVASLRKKTRKVIDLQLIFPLFDHFTTSKGLLMAFVTTLLMLVYHSNAQHAQGLWPTSRRPFGSLPLFPSSSELKCLRQLLSSDDLREWMRLLLILMRLLNNNNKTTIHVRLWMLGAKTSGSLDVIGPSPLTCCNYRDSSSFTLSATNYSNFFM